MLLSNTAILRLVDAIAILLARAYQLARIRLASAASPVLRLVLQRDQVLLHLHLLRRELEILRSQRQSMPPHRRPDYGPEQRLAILQLHRLRGWRIARTAQRFVIHPNTLRSWIAAVEGRGNQRLLTGAIVWNRIDDAVRWAIHELRRLCPEPELGSRSIARHLVRAGIALSRSTVQRVLRQPPPRKSAASGRPAMAEPAGAQPHHLLVPQHPNHVWHIDLTCLRSLCFRFTAAAILDGFSRKLLSLRLYLRTPTQRDMAGLVRRTTYQYGCPRFLISDHGTQFRRCFRAAMGHLSIRHVKGRVRAPYLNGKIERLFLTWRQWWAMVLPPLGRRALQRRLDDFAFWYNQHRPHSTLHGRTPEEACQGTDLPPPAAFRQRDPLKPQITVRRAHCRGDPLLPVIHIQVRRAA